jgi:hypothetical protein
MTTAADAAAPRDFLRFSRAAQWDLKVKKTALATDVEDPPKEGCQGTAVIDPPGPGYPLLGCVPAKPNSVSPGKNEFMLCLPTFQAFRKIHPDVR